LSLALLINFSALGLGAASRVAVESDSLVFQLMTEDGSTQIPCLSKPRPGGGPDWEVFCDDKRYAVHLAVIKYPLEKNQLKYQILYWVLDYNDRPDRSKAGTHHGTNLDVIFAEDRPTQTLKIGQVVDTIWSLNLQLRL